jgi:nucleoside-diphosphate-sugar epimerase
LSGRIALTGGGGFIGSHLTVSLHAAGAEVLLLGPPPLRSAASRSLVERGEVLWEADALSRSRAWLAVLLRGTRALVHLGYRPPSGAGALPILRAELTGNVVATARLLEAAADAGLAQVAFASSAQVYPLGEGNREDGPVAPTTPYGWAKLVQEELVRSWSRDLGRPAAVLRLTTVYGPGEPVRRAIPRFVSAALVGRPLRVDGRGEHRFAPVFVADVVAAFLAVLRARADGTYNVGGEPRTVREVAELVVALCGGGIPIEESGLPARPVPLCDLSRAERTLGLSRTALEVGLGEEIRWFRGRLPALPAHPSGSGPAGGQVPGGASVRPPTGSGSRPVPADRD